MVTHIPYVGVTGLSTVQEVQQTIQAFSDSGFDESDIKHVPMLGFLASFKTLSGVGVANRRYPAFEALPSLLEAANGAGAIFCTIHYNTEQKEDLASQVREIMLHKRIYERSGFMGLQLNIVWPSVGEVAKIKREFSKLNLILQINNGMMQGTDPSSLAGKIKDFYGGEISYALIDPSGGRGQEFDLNRSLNLFRALRSCMPELGVGFAGGFTGENAGQIIGNLTSRLEHSDFSIDAEGGIRDRITDAYGDDTFNAAKTRTYLRSAHSGFYPLPN